MTFGDALSSRPPRRGSGLGGNIAQRMGPENPFLYSPINPSEPGAHGNGDGLGLD